MNWNVVQLYIILLQLSRLRWNTHCLRACLSLFVSLEMSTQKLYKSVKPAIITVASTDIGVAQGKRFHLESLIGCLLCPKQFWSYYEKKAKCIVWNFNYLFYRFSTFRDFWPAVNKHYSAFFPLSPHQFVSACYCFSACSVSKGSNAAVVLSNSGWRRQHYQNDFDFVQWICYIIVFEMVVVKMGSTCSQLLSSKQLQCIKMVIKRAIRLR